ncbi:hypothetical protein GOODEAATRI_019802, partial [Goodea atripinnis]
LQRLTIDWAPQAETSQFRAPVSRNRLGLLSYKIPQLFSLISQKKEYFFHFQAYAYGKLLPLLQARQFSAATGLSRMLIILGAIEPTLKGENLSEEVIQRQVRIALTAALHHELKAENLFS